MWSPRHGASSTALPKGGQRAPSFVKLEKADDTAAACADDAMVVAGPTTVDGSVCPLLMRDAAALCLRAAEFAEAEVAAAAVAMRTRTVAHESACAALQADLESMSSASEKRVSGLQVEVRSEREESLRIAAELRAARRAADEGSSESAAENMRLIARVRDMNAVIGKQKKRIADHEERIRVLGACVTNNGGDRSRPRKRKRLSDGSRGEPVADDAPANIGREARRAPAADLTNIITREEDSIPVTQPGVPSCEKVRVSTDNLAIVDLDDDAFSRRSAHLAIAEVTPTPQGDAVRCHIIQEEQLVRRDDGPSSASLACLNDVPGLRAYVMPHPSRQGALVEVNPETSILSYGQSTSSRQADAREMPPPPVPTKLRTGDARADDFKRSSSAVGERGKAVRAGGRTAALAAAEARNAASGHFDQRGVPCRCVVRGKEARLGLRAFDCEQCRSFYDAAGVAPLSAGSTTSPKLSRHRFAHAPTNTPPGYWDLSFPVALGEGE